MPARATHAGTQGWLAGGTIIKPQAQPRLLHHRLKCGRVALALLIGRMFVLVRLQDIVRIAPSQFAININAAAAQAINAKFANKVWQLF